MAADAAAADPAAADAPLWTRKAGGSPTLIFLLLRASVSTFTLKLRHHPKWVRVLVLNDPPARATSGGPWRSASGGARPASRFSPLQRMPFDPRSEGSKRVSMTWPGGQHSDRAWHIDMCVALALAAPWRHCPLTSTPCSSTPTTSRRGNVLSARHVIHHIFNPRILICWMESYDVMRGEHDYLAPMHHMLGPYLVSRM